jgi:hypothetical protein
MSEEAETKEYEPFYNVRKGGPKEARLFRVALMGEFNSIKPVYWIKVEQKEGDDLISDDLMRETFQAYGKILKCHRPENKDTGEPRSFTLVGFEEPDKPAAVMLDWGAKDGEEITINELPVVVSEAKQWFAELYPPPGLSFMESLGHF